MLKTVQGFKDFVMRGNVIDLSVGIVIGAAFTTAGDGVHEGVRRAAHPGLRRRGHRRRRLRDQGRPLRLGVVHQRRDHVPDHGRGGVLPDRLAHEPAGRASPDAASSPSPGRPARRSCCCRRSGTHWSPAPPYRISARRRWRWSRGPTRPGRPEARARIDQGRPHRPGPAPRLASFRPGRVSGSITARRKAVAP